MTTCLSPDDTEDAADMLGVFSTGRSGSTWMGCLLDSHPDITYRFEPHAKSKGLSKSAADGIARLGSPDLADRDLDPIREGLLDSNPFSDKPPFFAKTRGALRMPGLRQLLCPAARRFELVRPIYRHLYTPRVDTALVFKLVAHERECARLIRQTSMSLVYLVRHPCGMVGSLLTGQARGKMPSGRRSVIADFLKDHAPMLHDRHGDRLAAMSAAEMEALLWRCSVEWAFGHARAPRTGVHLTFYENLCREPRQELTPIFEMMGRDLHPNVDRFISASTGGERRHWSEFGIGRYFSVFRDPRKSMSRWKDTLTTADQRAVLDLVEDSPIFRWGVEEADWDH